MTFGNVSASGITFPASVSASSNANTLDDYEEGTWTPEVADATTGGNTAAGGTFTAVYTKIGNVVICTMVLANINTTGMTGGNTLYVRGLPFVSVSGGVPSVGSIVADRITFSGFITPFLDSGGVSHLEIRESVSNTVDASLTVSDIQVSGGSDIFITLTYITV
jgi:hypothetical protein